MEIKRFLGFTNAIKEPRKTKVEDELSKSYRYNGKIYNAVTFLCVKLLEGCYPKKQENYQYYKRNGELTKPKTLYMYVNPNGKTYFELKKTEYDFVRYLIENGLDTEESMLTYDKVDIERLEALKQKEQEEKARQEAEEQKRVEEKEKFDRWIWEESQKIPLFQRDLIDSIFLAIYGEANTWNYSLAVCINNYNNPLCKKEVIARLHNDNKASIKIFECLTGLKLPKSYKKRKTYLEGLTVSDFKEVAEYKPRKKREEKEVQKEEFYIIEGSPSDRRRKKILAEPITKYAVDMFIFYSNGNWNLSLAESGLKVTSRRTKAECMKNLKKVIDKSGKDPFVKLVKDQTERVKKLMGINPRYKAA